MSVNVSFSYPKELSRIPSVQQVLKNAAEFVRDLWLARSPYASGEYARGLQRQSSVRVEGGKIQITNFSKYAWVIEKGFRSYNIGMAILNNGRGVKVGADGNRYKMVHIDPKGKAGFRKSSTASAVVRSFTKTMPLGMPITKLTKFGAIKPYRQLRALSRPIQGKRPPAHSPSGVFVISEKAIKENPSKWQMPARTGERLAEKVQKEARPFVVAALKAAVQAERSRQTRVRGAAPRPTPDMRSLFRMIPPARAR